MAGGEARHASCRSQRAVGSAFLPPDRHSGLRSSPVSGPAGHQSSLRNDRFRGIAAGRFEPGACVSFAPRARDAVPRLAALPGGHALCPGAGARLGIPYAGIERAGRADAETEAIFPLTRIPESALSCLLV